MLQTKESKNRRNYYLLPSAAVLLLLPVLVRCHIFDPKLNTYPWMAGDVNRATDMYLYYRSIFLAVSGGAICFLLAATAVLGKKRGGLCQTKQVRFSLSRPPSPIWFLLAYLLLCFVSTLFSTSPYFSLHGISNQFEPIFVLLTYGLLAVYTFAAVNREQDVSRLLQFLTVSCVILCVFGVFQLLSHDLLVSPLLKSWVFPGELNYNIEAVMEKNRVSLSFYNPNYVGLYAALMLPILLSLFLARKDPRKKAGILFLAAVLIVCLFGSQAKNGVISAGIAILMLLLFFRRSIRRVWKPVLLGLGCTVAAAFVLLLTGNPVIKGIVSAFQIQKTEYPLEDIRAGKDDVIVVYQGEELHASVMVQNDGQVAYSFRDGAGQELSSVYDEKTQEFYFTEPCFETIRIAAASFNGILGMNINIDGRDWPFTNQAEDGSWYYLNSANKLVKPEKARAVLNGYEGLLSGRGYIWGRTLPLLMKYGPFGSGPDTFLLVFPQTDYVMAANSGYAGQLVSRPHNMYLQIGVQTGVLSLLAFIGFYTLYLVSSFRLYWRSHLEDSLSRIGVGIFAGTFGYMISGLVNDTNVGVTPFFYIVMGIGLAVNYKLLPRHHE